MKNIIYKIFLNLIIVAFLCMVGIASIDIGGATWIIEGTVYLAIIVVGTLIAWKPEMGK